MSFLFQLNNQDLIDFRKNWGWFLLWGIALIALGTLSIVFSFYATVVSALFLGAVLTVGGIFICFDSFKAWWGKWSGFFMHLGIGVLYLIVGIMFIQQPLFSAISLTLLLGIFFLAIGIFRIIYSLGSDLPHKGWRFFNGVVTLILGILIIAEWPASGTFVLGLFIGIDLLFSGWVYVVASLAARKGSGV